MNVRRVVTGNNSQGRAVVVSDREVEAIVLPQRGTAFHPLWGADEVPVLPNDGSRPAQLGTLPSPGGFSFAFFTVPPIASVSTSSEGEPGDAAEKELQRLLDDHEANHALHVTDSIDLGVVLSGEIVLELSDGAEVVLRAGDAFVQNGTLHCWHNRGYLPAVVAVLAVGARRTS